MLWNIEKIWDGEEAFIIGGGPSLERFDWNLIKNEKVIGCNSAYRLGPEICDVCVFGDSKFFRAYEQDLIKYQQAGGIVFTNQEGIPNVKRLKWLNYLPRQSKGLATDKLGWNTNTGSTAINLALLFGVKVIFLLGFDMQLSPKGKSNWHVHGLDKPNETVCNRMKNYTELHVKKDLEAKFPDVKVINVTNHSNLNCFNKIGLEIFFKERTVKC